MNKNFHKFTNTKKNYTNKNKLLATYKNCSKCKKFSSIPAGKANTNFQRKMSSHSKVILFMNNSKKKMKMSIILST